MSVLAQISSRMPDRMVENPAGKLKIPPRSFRAASHALATVYAHLAQTLQVTDTLPGFKPGGCRHR